VRSASIVVTLSALAFSTGLAFSEEPILDHQPVLCSLPGKNPRVCAYVADDGEVKRTRAYFRAAGKELFYWTEMTFDGIQYCATLPIANGDIKGVDYYIWTIDDSFESKRTRTYTISVVPEVPCEYPVFDDDPERTAHLEVNATSPKQGETLEDFSSKGVVKYVPLTRKD
jgi:hypothetical protein